MGELTARLVADPYPPYQYEEEGAIKGADHDVVHQAFRTAGIEARTALHPWDECMRRMESGLADAVYQIMKTPEREHSYLFSDLLRAAKTVLFGLKYGVAGDAQRSNRFSARRPTEGLFTGLRLGVLGGYSYHPVVDGLAPAQKIETAGHGLLIQGLREGKFDLALMDLGVAERLFNELDIEDVARVGSLEITRDLYLAFQKDRGDLVKLFNEGLGILMRSGAYDAVYSRYGLTA
jgi:polar amino acid transport system substrate-binding protein